ncbi:MAG: RHS repeat protein [Rhizobacter sp.]
MDNNLCWTLTASTKYGVQMHGWAFIPAGDINYGWNVVARRDRTAECPYGYSQVNDTDGTILYCIKPACSACEHVGNPLSIATAEKNVFETDYERRGASTLEFRRSYSNQGYYRPIAGGLVRTPGFGDFWRHSYNRTVLAESPGSLMASALRPNATEKHFRSDGREVLNIDGAGDHLSMNGTGGWLYRSMVGDLETYASDGKLNSIASAHGGIQSMLYSDATTPVSVASLPGLLVRVTDSFGRSLAFAYNDRNQLSSMTDPAGGVYQYAFDSNDMLTQVRSPDGTTRQYGYQDNPNFGQNGGPYAITRVTDELGARYATYGYRDGYWGTPDTTEHAGGTNKYVRSLNGSFVQITDPAGGSTQYSIQSVNGVSRMATQSQPAGSGCSASTSNRTFDANGNIASRDDFNGTRSCYVSDLSRNLETSRVEGLSQATDCTTVTASNASLPVNSRKVSTQWHPDWRLSTKTAEPGRITTSVYNGQPDPFNGNALASCAPNTALLPDGKPIAVLCKSVEQATTDTDGHLGFSATLQSGVASRTQSWTYNQYGQVLTAKGPRTDVNDTTTYAYYTDTTTDHTLGDLQSVTNAAGKVTSYTQYNKHGQVLQSQDPNGVVTVNTYDLRQRLKSTTVAGQTTSYSYDAVGQLKKVTLPDQSWVGYDYDDAHRQVAVYDNQGNRSDYVLDNAGNKTAETIKDPSGNLKRQLSRSIDALGRVQQTTGRE